MLNQILHIARHKEMLVRSHPSPCKTAEAVGWKTNLFQILSVPYVLL